MDKDLARAGFGGRPPQFYFQCVVLKVFRMDEGAVGTVANQHPMANRPGILRGTPFVCLRFQAIEVTAVEQRYLLSGRELDSSLRAARTPMQTTTMWISWQPSAMPEPPILRDSTKTAYTGVAWLGSKPVNDNVALAEPGTDVHVVSAALS